MPYMLISRLLRRPGIMATIGMAGMIFYAAFATSRMSLRNAPIDTRHFGHFASTNFRFGSSFFDLSVISPYQGLGGLVQPIAVRMHPTYLIPYLIGTQTDVRYWGSCIGTILIGLATFYLGRVIGLPIILQVIPAQLIGIFSFMPAWTLWSSTNPHGLLLYYLVPACAVPVALAIFFLAVFTELGNVSISGNCVRVLLLPLLLIYSILCDPLYTAVFWVPSAFFSLGVLFGSSSRPVLKWRIIGGIFCLLIFLLLNLHNYYRYLIGYAARAVFPNELYVEIQQWDYLTGLFFQKWVSTLLMLAFVIFCISALKYGSRQARCFAAGVLAFIGFMITISLIYVYSGVRWSLPLPAYYELGAQPAYLVAGSLGLWLTYTRRAGRMQNFQSSIISNANQGASRRNIFFSYFSIMFIPSVSVVLIMESARGTAAKVMPVANPELNSRNYPISDFLAKDVEIRDDGIYRGSVATLFGIPGGQLMDSFRVPMDAAYNKRMMVYGMEKLFSVDPNLDMTGLWDRHIPTLEDNTQLVTPPFHFLISRALSRPQDYHSRNWSVISKANPKLMAALGTRFILSDQTLNDPQLTMRKQFSLIHGIPIYIYEIQNPNTGNFSPIQSILSLNATQTLQYMTDNNFKFEDAAVVHDNDVDFTNLTHADFGQLSYERGGFRVRGRSSGRSLLVLPVQFSNALHVVGAPDSRTSTPVQLKRVNLLETGVLFSGEIDIKVAHIFGPFRDVQGRLQDIEDCKRLAIKETGEIPYPPDYQPLSLRRPK